MPSPRLILAFDLYGTLLNTDSIVKELALNFGNEADSVATLWRRYQLEYTWRLNLSCRYKSFDEVTRASLGHALAEINIDLSEENIDGIMHSYDSLSTFPDVGSALKARSDDPSIDAYIFSNGTKSCLPHL